MLNLIEPVLTERQVNYVRLDGSVPQKKRHGLERGDDGKLKMTVTFPDESALDNLAKSLARMVGTAG